MDQMMQRRAWGMGTFVLLALGLFLTAQFINTVKANRYIGAGMAVSNTISVSGNGEVQAVPDIATVYVTIREDGKTQKEAQDKATAKESKVLEAIRGLGVEDKDIKTTSNSVNPQYNRTDIVCITYPCPQPKQEITGYEAYESIEVKVRETEDAGKITAAITNAGAEFSGPNYAIDEDEMYKDQAREKAIDDAREKAEKLAAQLGVHLVRITSFSENGNYPMMYAKAEMAMDSSAGAPVPQLPKGENTITSSVTVTYEIR
jgi:uncharacterized protein YggE